MLVDEAVKYLIDAQETSYINHFFVEGGEPFLYPDLLLSIVREANARGYWIGALTNAFWAVSDERARQVMEPLAEAGLQSLGVSTDAWHREFVSIERAERAVMVAGSLGIETDLMVCSGGSGAEGVFAQLRKDGFEVYASRVVCRGRASSSEACQTEANNWRSFDHCSESFGGRSRVHIGPFGEIHLCQGLLLGSDARRRPLAEIFADSNPADHPICDSLISGGPTALAELAQDYGFAPKTGYADGCQLCFEARRYLRGYFPKFIGPDELYKGLEVA